MDERTFVGILAVTFGLFFFVVSLMTIFLPGFGDVHLAILASIAVFIENTFPSLKELAFPLAMFIDWILVFGFGFTIGAAIVIYIRHKDEKRWGEFAASHGLTPVNSSG